VSRSSGFVLVLLAAFSISVDSLAADPDQAYIDKARKVYMRLTGRKPKLTDTNFMQMVTLMKAGKDVDAAAIATADSGFVNNTLRLFAAPIHNASQSYRETRLSESMAYIMGKIRDRSRIEEILTGKDYYVPDLSGVTCTVNGAATTGAACCQNNEDAYACAERFLVDLSTKLQKNATPARPIYTSQTTDLGNDQGRVRGEHPAMLPNGDMDRSGIFTMDGFGYAGLRAGTNRRILQQLFNTTFCLNNSALRASVSVIDKWVGPDVSRDPEGTGLDAYRKECRTCHGATFDGMRGAFAYLDAGEGGENNTRNRTILVYDNSRVNDKYFRNANNYPNGYRTTSNAWEIMWTDAQRSAYGWDGSGALSGQGVATLATALTHFSQFQSCMVQKVAELVCPVDPNLTTLGANQLLSAQAKQEFAAELKRTGDLRHVFEAIAVRPECLGGSGTAGGT
jgi:hypothetical protein